MSDNRIIECMERAQYLLGNLMAVKPPSATFISGFSLRYSK